ncbi:MULTISPECIES: hypothetical protein [unclassified Campylobacter]|uniref:hypothetical protein n=1 Tax=unclassified Campylobacter TaxID=2593542 RepID=UPI003D33EAEE
MNLFKELKISFFNTFYNHKAESILIVLLSVAYMVAPSYYYDLEWAAKGRAGTLMVYAYLPLLLVVIYSLRRFRQAYWAAFAGAFMAILAVVKFGLYDYHFVVFTAIAFILLLSDKFAKQNEIFTHNALKKLSNLALALTMGIVVSILYFLIIGGIFSLFDLYTSSNGFGFTLFLATTCWFFMVFEDADFSLSSLLFEKIFNFLLTPTLVIYTFIIHIYIVKIVLISGLPHGEVAYIMISYLTAGLVLCAIFEISSEKKWEKFYCYFWLFSLAPIVLLWFGVIERVSTYGLTTERIHLLSVSMLLSVIYAFKITKFLFSYRLISAVCMIFLCLIFFVIDTAQITINSQTKRLNELVQRLNLTSEQAVKNLSSKQKDEIQDIIYTIRRYDSEFKPIPQLLKVMDQTGDYINNLYFKLNNSKISADKISKIFIDRSPHGCGIDDDCLLTVAIDDKRIEFNLKMHIQNVLKKYEFDRNATLSEQKQSDIENEILVIESDKNSLILDSLDLYFSGNIITNIQATTLMVITTD